MKYCIEVLKGDSGSWFWRIIHKRNGNTLAHSETYSSKEKALKTARNLHAAFKRRECGLSVNGGGMEK